MAEQELYEKQSSIEVSRNAKGDYSWKIKLYFNEERREWSDVNAEIQGADKDLKARFG